MSATTLFQSPSHPFSRSTFLDLFKKIPSHFNNVTKVQFQIGARCVVVLEEQKLTCVPMQDGGSLKSVFTLTENRRHKVTQKVAHHHKQNTVRCHLQSHTCSIHCPAQRQCTTSTRNTTAQRRDSKLTNHVSATELRPLHTQNARTKAS